MNKIVKYHNDFNRVRIPSCGELEQNILMGILANIKGTNNTTSTFLAPALKEFCQKSLTNKELFDRLCLLRVSFFKADFTILLKEQIAENRFAINEQTINLFDTFSIHYTAEDPKGEKFLDFEKLEVAVNPKFAYLVNKLSGNFTRFELMEFIALNSKYSKTLYRHLKQFRTTGLAKFEWDEFCEFMDFPKGNRMCDIDRDLKNAVKELTAERNLFDQVRVPFKNLKYEKIKGKGRGRGGKVIGIKFTFDKEIIDDKMRGIKGALSRDEKLAKLNEFYIDTRFMYMNTTYKIIEARVLETQNIIMVRVQDLDNCDRTKRNEIAQIPFDTLEKLEEFLADKMI